MGGHADALQNVAQHILRIAGPLDAAKFSVELAVSEPATQLQGRRGRKRALAHARSAGDHDDRHARSAQVLDGARNLGGPACEVRRRGRDLRARDSQPARAEGTERRGSACDQLFGQDPLMQDGQDRSGLGALMFERSQACLLKDVERRRAQSQRVVGANELRCRSLAARVCGDGRPELPDHLLVLPGRESRIIKRVDGHLPLIAQASDGGGKDFCVGQVRQRRITPQRERVDEGFRCRRRVASVKLGLPLGDKVSELVDIELARTDRHHVTALLAMTRRAPARRANAFEPGGAQA
jgi:hypothetical protein